MCYITLDLLFIFVLINKWKHTGIYQMKNEHIFPKSMPFVKIDIEMDMPIFLLAQYM